MNDAAHGMARSRFYGIVLVMTVVAYAWVGYNAYVRAHDTSGISICIIRSVTGVPCPGCGATRSVMHLMHGDVLDALRSNPLGIAAVIALGVIPWWIVVDLATGRSSLIDAYTWSNRVLRQRAVMVGVLFFIACLWTWNIYNQGISR